MEISLDSVLLMLIAALLGIIGAIFNKTLMRIEKDFRDMRTSHTDHNTRISKLEGRHEVECPTNP